MQFIKSGRLYNTDTAKRCGGYRKYIRTPENEADINMKYNLFKKRLGNFSSYKKSIGQPTEANGVPKLQQ